MTASCAIPFTIAKKMNKSAQGSAGLALRSLRGDAQSAAAVLLGSEYDLLKDACERYRMRTGRPLHFRVRGRSLELFAEAGLTGESALSALMDFLKETPLAAEEALDVVAFYDRCLGFDAAPLDCGGASATLRADRMFLDLSELSLSVTASCGGEIARETLYDVVAAILPEYDMGLVKETPGSVVEKPAG